MWPTRADRLCASQMAVGIVQRFQAIEIQHHERHRTSARTHGVDQPAQLTFERSEVVQSGQVVRHRHRVQPPGIGRQRRRDDADRDEERHLHEVRLVIAECEQGWIGEVIQHDRAQRCGKPAAPIQREGREDDGQVVQVLERSRAGATIEDERQQQSGGDAGDRHGA